MRDSQAAVWDRSDGEWFRTAHQAQAKEIINGRGVQSVVRVSKGTFDPAEASEMERCFPRVNKF
jgi:hypothetical protein